MLGTLLFLVRKHTGSCVQFRRSLASKVLPCTSGDTVKSLMSAGGADYHDFPKEEEKILELWEKLDAFQSCLRQSKDKPRYSFYDGPPFATGLPHYGHILAGTIKDIVTRFAHQSGYHVERRFGWDCHGLPVEYEIDQKLGLKSPEDVTKMGIANYNQECRKIVMRYSKEWEFIVKRIGRWIDFRNDYKTLYPWFMESVWWTFKQLYDKGMVYRGFKVMPYSTRCNTPLSNFEANQNYKDTMDPSVIVNFPLDESPDVSVIAWTTTPWTLPSNLALVVNPNFDYVRVKDCQTNNVYIMMEARLEALFKKPEEYQIMERFKGAKLKGKTYRPLFNYFHDLKDVGAFRVLADGYVTDDSGTGVVHSAPAFGEDDYRVCLANGIIRKGGKLPCPVDASGVFTDEVSDFRGQHVKDADKNIMRWLKQSGRLVHQSTHKHNYPFCWRSDTPLIYKAVPGWFIQVESIVEKLLLNNKKSYWVPEFVQEKRFHNWLENARDWNVSRNRYWGTPIPLWVSEDYEEVVCIGSIDELAELSGVKVEDLHRDSIDHITIPSKKNKGILKRVSEVFDCWFESGSMPYAQVHYPFENKKEFEVSFPADFIAEGIDQTRGWFYTLLVISTALFDEPPFKNLIVSGLVLAEDGTKMSKRKKNYPDPLEIVGKYGADALRLYLINSPVVRAETLKFQEKGVKDIIKDVFLPWYNAHRFLLQNIQQMEMKGAKFVHDESHMVNLDNTLDRWILSFTQSLVLFVEQEMAAYRLYTVVPRLVKFIDYLTNVYVRMNRKRLRGEHGDKDRQEALQTLFSVIFSMTRLMASFTPFLTEHTYQALRPYIPETMKSGETESIHYLMLPKAREDLIDKEIERRVALMLSVIELGRVVRERKTLPIKYPIPEIVVIHQQQQSLDDVLSLETYIKQELNVRKITVSSDKDKFGVRLKAEPDNQTLGRRLKGAFKEVSQQIKGLSDEEIQVFQEKGQLMVAGHLLSGTDLKIMYSFDQNNSTPSAYEAHSDGEVLILLDTTPDEAMLSEGVAREVVNRIQKLRKKAKLQPIDDITIVFDVKQGSPDAVKSLNDVIKTQKDYIEESVKQPLVSRAHSPSLSEIIRETTEVKGAVLDIGLLRGHQSSAVLSSDVAPGIPLCSFVNIQLCGVAKPRQGTVLLENPRGTSDMTLDQLKRQVALMFNQSDINSLKLSLSASCDSLLTSKDVTTLNGSQVYAFVKS
ncbi:PREDICTED: isoleucine--tRNA ligase, cytoplasmic-like [Acropora digitifera]|uniref:isoleucine--tRNA ligase, cytoplasmic-like n=1 Tax=Acropora digitifera TaxID=70779 RepID=UPI00077AD9E1|nr:PREDICTED: isoleucine--tRNA ligase, cytoplasmic-like [Acropora digitifera]